MRKICNANSAYIKSAELRELISHENTDREAARSLQLFSVQPEEDSYWSKRRVFFVFFRKLHTFLSSLVYILIFNFLKKIKNKKTVTYLYLPYTYLILSHVWDCVLLWFFLDCPSTERWTETGQWSVTVGGATGPADSLGTRGTDVHGGRTVHVPLPSGGGPTFSHPLTLTLTLHRDLIPDSVPPT